MGNFISARQFKGNWTANSINLNSQTATRLLWVTDSWEQSCQPGRDTKFNAVSTPVYSSPQKPALLKGITRTLLLTGGGDASLLEKKSLGRKGLLQAAADNAAPGAQSSSAEEHFMPKPVVSNTEVWNFTLTYISVLSEDLKIALRRFSCSKLMYLQWPPNHEFSGYAERRIACSMLTQGLQRSLFRFHIYQRRSSLPPPRIRAQRSGYHRKSGMSNQLLSISKIALLNPTILHMRKYFLSLVSSGCLISKFDLCVIYHFC